VKLFNLYFLLIFSILPLLGCKQSNKSNKQIDIKSYINDFELLQENPNNQTSVKITSPKAIIHPTNNDIEIFDSSIQITNKNGQDFQVKSGNSTLNNLSNFIRVYNNVNISFLDNEDYYINTNAIGWDLNTSVINMKNLLNISFDSSKIIASNGTYNIESNLLKLDNTQFNKHIYNSDGHQVSQVEIKSEFAKWFKNENTLVFTSNDKQVETTIKFLLTE